MKVRFYGLIFTLMILASCTEVLPKRSDQITLVDTSYIVTNPSSPQPKKVLFEEYTGASCVNCPDGHAKLKEISDRYASKMAIVGLHFGDLSQPVHSQDQDLRTSFAADLGATFGVASMPSATIDRKSFGGNTILGRLEWLSRFESVVNNPVKVNITTKSYLDNNTNRDALEVTIEVLEDYAGSLNYSIAMIENKISVAQKNGSAVIEDYEQEHVLRKMYTSSLGNALKKSSGSTIYEKGKVYKKTIELNNIDSKWKRSDLYIVTFVTDELTREVLQASEVKFQQ